MSLRRGAFDHYVYNIFPDVADHLLLVHSVVRFGHLRLQMGIYVLNLQLSNDTFAVSRSLRFGQCFSNWIYSVCTVHCIQKAFKHR